jgi:uncharacterized protein (DUF1800 family)
MPSLQPIAGALGVNRAKHLLRRLTYGTTKQQVNQYAGLSVQTALAQLLGNWIIPAHPLALPDAWEENPPAGGAWVDKKTESTEKDFVLTNYFKWWWLGRMATDATAQEKLVFFLHTVITNKNEVGGGSRAMYWQNALFRQYLYNDFTNQNPKFNRYTQFIKKVCVDSSMLAFLDGRLNVAGRPNENFARELLELFTIGKGKTGNAAGDYGNYTETDIKEAAKALTGWDFNGDFHLATSLDPDTNLPTGKVKGNDKTASEHDNTVKTLTSAFVSTQFPSPKIIPNPTLMAAGSNGQPTVATPASAADEISQLVDIIYAKEQAARYFCRKLVRFFVYWNITDQIENDIIAPLAATFMASGYRIRPVLEQLCSSSFFFDADTGNTDDKFGAIVKSPLEVTLGTLRYFETSFAPLNSETLYKQMSSIESNMYGMGLDFLNPYDVAGYEPYHQAPFYNRNWITTNTLAIRYKFIRDFVKFENDWGFDVFAWATNDADLVAVATNSTIIDGMPYAFDLVKYVVGQFLPLPELTTEITQKRMNYFAKYHLGSYTFADWQTYWNQRNGVGKPYVTEMLLLLLNAVLQSPEYQLF